MSKNPFASRKTIPLTDGQLELLQAFIDDKPLGMYDAMDLIPDEYRDYFSVPQVHGAQFASAVTQDKLKGIEPRGMDKDSKHMRYALHGYSPAKPID